ncbi:major outer membrane protein [Aliarcobacter cryaerophilus]|uniref:major outer membrane protein n=1 Tax=Aliarcobacter cryaerophilus TaxID=28198 RepID=UPI003DA26A3D
MRKISKISLVAAVAVAGFSTANAQPLEEAIKNVDVSGSVVYRYDNFHNAEKKSNGVVTSERKNTDANRYKIGLNLSSKVNDYVKFNSRFIVGSQTDGGFATLNAGKEDNNSNTAGSDGQADVSLSNAYFGFTAIPNTVVNIGKQGLTTPYTVAVDINGNEQTGTGILALSTFGPVTAGAGYFNNSNLDKSGNINGTMGITVSDLVAGAGKKQDSTNKVAKWNASTGSYSYVNGDITAGVNGGSDLYVATVQGDLDFVKLEAWYLGMQDTFNSYTLAATSNIDLAENAKLGLEARYVSLSLDNNLKKELALNDNNNAMFRFAVDGKVSIVNARLAYTKTDKDGGLTAFDQDAKNTSLGWFITSNGIADADYIQAALGADILDNLNFTAHYGNLKADASNKNTLNAYSFGNGGLFGTAGNDELKQQEIYGQLTYKMSKNLSTYLRYGQFKEKIDGDKTMDQNAGRLQVAYTF